MFTILTVHAVLTLQFVLVCPCPCPCSFPPPGPVRRILLPPEDVPARQSACVLTVSEDGSVALVCCATGSVVQVCRGYPHGAPLQVAWNARRCVALVFCPLVTSQQYISVLSCVTQILLQLYSTFQLHIILASLGSMWHHPIWHHPSWSGHKSIKLRPPVNVMQDHVKNIKTYRTLQYVIAYGFGVATRIERIDSSIQ